MSHPFPLARNAPLRVFRRNSFAFSAGSGHSELGVAQAARNNKDGRFPRRYGWNGPILWQACGPHAANGLPGRSDVPESCHHRETSEMVSVSGNELNGHPGCTTVAGPAGLRHEAAMLRGGSENSGSEAGACRNTRFRGQGGGRRHARRIPQRISRRGQGSPWPRRCRLRRLPSSPLHPLPCRPASSRPSRRWMGRARKGDSLRRRGLRRPHRCPRRHRAGRRA